MGAKAEIASRVTGIVRRFRTPAIFTGVTAASVGLMMLGGNIIGGESPTVTAKDAARSKTPTPDLTAKPTTREPIKTPTRTPPKEIPSRTPVFYNGTWYSPVSGSSFPAACATGQLGGTMYMQEGGGTAKRPDGKYYTAWRCKNGKRQDNPIQ